jgi:predicted nuclease of restriction endonuclease-like (RecB) superfamily
MISSRYDQKIKDVQEWLSITEWSQENIDYKTIDKIQSKLLELEIIPTKVNYEDLVFNL